MAKPEPHSLGTITIMRPNTPAQKKLEGGWLARHPGFKKGDVLPETQVDACPRVRVADLPEKHLKKKWFERLEQDQTLKSCCRHPEDHDVEARKSHPDEGAPDIYIFHCTCGRRHRFFCVGLEDVRPVWNAG